MPGGAAPLGFAYFVAAKYIGYTAFCNFAIKPRLPKPENTETSVAPVSSWLAGAIRTGIGIAVGAAVGLGFWKIPWLDKIPEGISTWLFFALLIPVRVGEWWLLLRLAYKNLIPQTGASALSSKASSPPSPSMPLAC